MDIILIDHYDSFSMNVLDWLEKAGFSVSMFPHDSPEMETLLETASQMVSPPLTHARSGHRREAASSHQGASSAAFYTPANLELSPSRGLNLASRSKSLFTDEGNFSSADRTVLPENAFLPAGERQPLVFGPGPKAPTDYPNSLKLLSMTLYHWPILGVCLGHQMLGTVAGLNVKRSQDPHHGSTREIYFESASPLFRGLANPMSAATYNSLVVCGELDHPWRIGARNEMGEIEALENLKGAGAFGIQFHPESFLSHSGPQIAKNWFEFLRSLALP